MSRHPVPILLALLVIGGATALGRKGGLRRLLRDGARKGIASIRAALDPRLELGEDHAHAPY